MKRMMQASSLSRTLTVWIHLDCYYVSVVMSLVCCTVCLHSHPCPFFVNVNSVAPARDRMPSAVHAGAWRAPWRIWSPLRASLRDSACESYGTKERRSAGVDDTFGEKGFLFWDFSYKSNGRWSQNGDVSWCFMVIHSHSKVCVGDQRSI